MQHELAAHILQQLGMLSSDRVKLGRTYSYVTCPFHAERTPSCIVRHDGGALKTGFFKCYGCQTKGHWNKLALAMGLEGYGGDSLLEDLPEFKSEAYDSFMLNDDDGFGESNLKHFSFNNEKARDAAGIEGDSWRGYSLKFLESSVGGHIVLDQDTSRYYIYLPVSVNGQERGYIRAQVVKPADKKIPSYLNKPGAWSLTYGLFPFDTAIKLMNKKNLRTIVLVEGPRDALRLIRFGIPAVSILGTHSWSNTKSTTIANAGVERIIPMFDGDTAGKIAYNLIVKGKSVTGHKPGFLPIEESFEIKPVKLWNIPVESGFGEDKYDPGNMPKTMLKRVKNLVYEVC